MRPLLAEDVAALDDGQVSQRATAKRGVRTRRRRDLREVADQEPSAHAHGRQVERVRARSGERVLVARIGVAGDTHPGIGREHALEPLGRVVGPVGDDDHARVDGVADPDPAPVVHAHPSRARGDVHERVQDRPVGDRVRAVTHCLCLAVRRGHRAGVEVIAADDDRRGHRSRAHELVDRESGLGSVAIAEPADPGRQALERDAPGRKLEPPLQQRVVRKQRRELPVDRVDVGGIARECGPAEGPDAATEQRPDVCGDEARVGERVAEARVERLAPKVVAVVEDVAPCADELGHRPDVRDDRLAGKPEVRLRVAVAQRRGLLEAGPRRARSP